MNSVTFAADTSGVRPASDNYFVRLDVGSGPKTSAPPKHGRSLGTTYEESPPPRSRRRRKRVESRTVFVSVLAIVLITWFAWAVQQPGGVSGVINGFIDNVRGEVQDVSAGPGLDNAVKYYNEQYRASGVYPQPTEEQLTSAGIGIDVDEVYCGGQAVVLRTLTLSRLLVAGEDLGEVGGRYGCPANLANPSPWKAKSP